MSTCANEKAKVMQATITWHIEQERFVCAGDWTLAGIETLARQLRRMQLPRNVKLDCQLGEVAQMDSAGAYLLLKLTSTLEKAKNTVQHQDFHTQHKAMYDLIASDSHAYILTERRRSKSLGILAEIGMRVYTKCAIGGDLLHFLGKTVYTFYLVLCRLKFPGWRGVFVTIERAGYHSLPIIALLLFLIGVVLAFQMGLQLKQYGANIYIVGLSGTAMVREFGPLITAILVAGKNASAFTAEIGSMQINEEIDALYTMGLSPTERLVLPKIVGMLIALPLLTIWANAFGILGSMVMSKSMLHITYTDFVARFKHDVSLRNYIIGLTKTPIFAFIIAGVGCFQGFRVERSAESLGRKTTISVVQAIFLIIVIDAWFSVMFSWTGG
jgi:phospholipid/cholesterol/gamma-HCH transport system permease protein